MSRKIRFSSTVSAELTLPLLKGLMVFNRRQLRNFRVLNYCQFGSSTRQVALKWIKELKNRSDVLVMVFIAKTNVRISQRIIEELIKKKELRKYEKT